MVCAEENWGMEIKVFMGVDDRDYRSFERRQRQEGLTVKWRSLSFGGCHGPHRTWLREQGDYGKGRRPYAESRCRVVVLRVTGSEVWLWKMLLK